MKRFLYISLVLSISFSAALAQDATPTPTPTPTADDTQNVQPENLKGVPTIAPNYQQDDKSLPDLGRVGVDMMQQRPLSLREAIVMALENNKDIEVTRQNVRIAEYDLQAANGFYEPRLAGQTFFERATTPNVSIFSNNATTTNSSIVGNIGLQGSLRRFGTSYNASINRQDVRTTNPISILSPQTNTSFNLSFTQPLFRGRKFDQPRRAIEIAKRNLSLTDTQFRQRSIEIITNVQRAYWDLVFALRNLQVQRDGVRDAKAQLEHNRRLVEEGQLAPIDIVAAETQVANIEQGVYEALEAVNRAENALKNLIANSKNDTLWNEAIVPTDSVDLDAPRTTLPEAYNLALQNRPEIEVNNTQKEINEIDQKYYRDQSKPQIDLTASYTTSGVGGSQNPDFRSFIQSPCETDPNSPACLEQIVRINALTGSSITDLFANRYPTFRVGVTFNLPLRNQTAQANLGKSLVQRDQIQTQREQLEQSIQVDVRNALQAIRTAEARLRSAAIARENSQKQYESEQRKLDAGQSDIYKVLERQTALMNARSAELRAQTELNKAIADLQRATGNSLKANDIEARLRK
jgi:HAE1 family hydrophobic/amphiphilic exporter-1